MVRQPRLASIRYLQPKLDMEENCYTSFPMPAEMDLTDHASDTGFRIRRLLLDPNRNLPTQVTIVIISSLSLSLPIPTSDQLWPRGCWQPAPNLLNGTEVETWCGDCRGPASQPTPIQTPKLLAENIYLKETFEERNVGVKQ